MNFPQIDMIILNWNGPDDTIECLESVYKLDYPNYNVILVDNGSEDDSIKKIKKYCEGEIEAESKFFDYTPVNKPIKIFEYSENHLNIFENDKLEFNSSPPNKKVILIKNHSNKGYAEGNNVGMRFVLEQLNSDYILILNNDIVVDPNFLGELVTIARENPDVGILGPANLSYYEPDKVDSMGAKMNFWTGGWKPIETNKHTSGNNMGYIDVDFVLGAAFMIKREVIERIGVFYSPYFANWEETEYCIKAKNSDFRVISVPKSKIWHKVSSSISLNNPNRIYWILRNNIIFMRRNSKLRFLPSFFIFYFFIRVPSFIYWGIRGESIQNSFKLIQMVIKAINEGLTFKINRY